MTNNHQPMPIEEYCKKYNIRCGCGKQSVLFDSWFNYYPCEDHKYLTPSQYSVVFGNPQWRVDK